MSELNIFGLREYYRRDILFEDTTDELREADKFYIMHEADAVIAELNKKFVQVDQQITELKAQKAQAEDDCAYWKTLAQKNAADNAVMAKQRAEALKRESRQKYKRCLARAERYKMIEFIAREEGNLCSQMSWSQYLRKRTYNQWVDQLLRIANLANKLHNKCRAKAEQYK